MALPNLRYCNPRRYEARGDGDVIRAAPCSNAMYFHRAPLTDAIGYVLALTAALRSSSKVHPIVNVPGGHHRILCTTPFAEKSAHFPYWSLPTDVAQEGLICEVNWLADTDSGTTTLSDLLEMDISIFQQSPFN